MSQKYEWRYLIYYIIYMKFSTAVNFSMEIEIGNDI